MGLSSRYRWRRRADARAAETTDVGVARWKGKRKQAQAQVQRRDEGPGKADGVVIDLKLVGDGIYSAIYTVPVTVGTNKQVFSLQVDTGSSDLWIASTACTSGPCSSGKPRLYDSTGATATGQQFHIDYLSGSVDGPIVWDNVVLGGYDIQNQALAAATNVVNETLGPDYSGILGLALPLNSVIGRDIPPVTNNAPDGATVPSNLFGITPADDAPSQLFMSLLLERPGSERVPSVLGIGRHPSASMFTFPDGSALGDAANLARVEYDTLVPENDGVHFWKAELRALTVYVGGVAKSVDVGRGASGSLFPEAILDSGVPYILASPAIANGIWGALGIGPASDGNYYVPCTTPLNMTVTLDGRGEIPLHPLDLSGISNTDPSGGTCVGLVQASSALADPLGVSDVILGVPFLRNVYSVMAYQTSDGAGLIGGNDADDKEDEDDRPRRSRGRRRQSVGPGLYGRADPIRPRLGLLNITDPATALTEFNTVRVMKQPLDSDRQNAGAAGGGGHRLSVGLAVLIGLLSFVALCAVLFFVRWFMVRRQLMRNGSLEGHGAGSGNGKGGAFVLGFGKRRGAGKDKGEGSGVGDTKDAYALTSFHDLAAHHSRSDVPSVDTQRTLATFPRDSDPFGKLDATYDSAHTRVASMGGKGDDAWKADGELGFHRASGRLDTDSDPGSERGRDDDEEREDDGSAWIDAYAADQPALHGEWRPPMHERTTSATSVHSAHSHARTLSQNPGLPLLSPPLDGLADPFLRPRSLSTLSGAYSRASFASTGSGVVIPLVGGAGVDEFGAQVRGMAGIGTARRGSVIDGDLSAAMHRDASSLSSSPSAQPRPVSFASTVSGSSPTAGLARPRASRQPSGPRPTSTMSRVISADDIS